MVREIRIGTLNAALITVSEDSDNPGVSQGLCLRRRAAVIVVW
jgi:hypothetical protein